MAKKKNGKAAPKAKPMAKAKGKAKATAKPKPKDLSPKPTSTRMVVGGRRAQISM